jgi:hypothetical protein
MPDELHGWGYAIALGIAALIWAGWAVMVHTGYGRRR